MRAHPLLFGLVALASFGCDGPYVVLDGLATNCSVEGPDSVRVAITPGQVADAAFEVACRAVTGAIEVAVPTAGRDLDPDGYAVLVNGAPTTRVYPGGSVVLEGLSPGSHLVMLDDFTLNCDLNGPATRNIMVTAGSLTRDTVRVAFEGRCQPVTGDVDIFATTGGVDWDPDGYTVTIDGRLEIEPCGWYYDDCWPGTPLMLPPNASLSFYLVPPGDHIYEIGDIEPNCTVLDGASRIVSVVAGETAEVRFDVTCQGS